MATSSNTAKTQAAAAAAATKAAATNAAAATRSASLTPIVTSTLGATNKAIAALQAVVTTKNPTAAQQKASAQANAAMKAANAVGMPQAQQVLSAYNTAVDTINQDYVNTMAGVNAMPDTITTTDTTTTQDAYSMVKSTVAQWFGGNPAWVAAATDFLNKEISGNNGPDTILYDFRQQDFYKARFSGNIARAANGLNVLTEADYISLENKYSTLFENYGVGTSSATNLSTQSQFATLIGNDISPTELSSRLDLAVNQVQQADPTVLNTLKQYYPTISNSNLVGYFLAPSQALPALERQVQTADIGAAAAQQGLSDTLARAGQLAAYGVTYAQAQAGYGKIAENLPASQKLSGIYGNQTGINYDQTTAENQYLMNSGAAALEQQKLADLEKQQFSGRSGVVGASAAAGYGGSLGKSIQGQF
jgi:hypothetical protein